MTDEDVRKLLGGYATNTLSAEEQKALYEAALKDQKLFEELAGEQALREMVDDPRARTALLRAMQPRAARRWMAKLSIAASIVAVASLAFVFNRSKDRPVAERTDAIVQTSPSAPEIPRGPRAKDDLPAQVRKPGSPAAPAIRGELRAKADMPAAAPKPTAPAAPAVRGELRVKADMPAVAPKPGSPVAAAIQETRAKADVPGAAPKSGAPAAPAIGGELRAKADVPDAATQTKALREQKADVSNDVAPMVAATRGPRASPNPAAVTSGPLRYTVLKRAADGSYRAVDSVSTFAQTDSVKLNVEAGEPGFLEVSLKDPPKLLFGGQVEKQVPVIVPPAGDIPLASGHALRIQFSQQAFASGAPSNALRRPQRTAPPVKQKAAREPGARKAADQVVPRQPITIEVDLKVAPPAKP